MGLKDLFVTEVKENEGMERYAGYDFSTIADSTSIGQEITPDNLIEAAYSRYLVSTGNTANISKVSDIKAGIPSTVTDADKKTMVRSTLPVFGMSVEDVIADGEAKVTAIQSALSELNTKYSSIITTKEDHITELQAEIEREQSDISNLQNALSNSTSMAAAEIEKLRADINFIKE